MTCAMAGRITERILDCRDPAGLACWWAEGLGYEVRSTDDDGATEIGPPGQPQKGPVPTLVFLPVTDPAPGTRPTGNRRASSRGCSPWAPPRWTSVRGRCRRR